MSTTEPDTESDAETETEQTGPFEAIIADGTLRTFNSAITPIVDEAKIRLTDDGLTVTAVDPAQVAMVSTALYTEAFESYPESTQGVLGANLTRIDDILSLGGTSDLVHMNLNPETRKLHFEVDGLEYTLALIDPDTVRQEPDIPDLDLPLEARFPASEIKKAAKAADMVSDHIAIEYEADAEALRFTAEGDTDDAVYTVPDDELEIVTGTADARSLFSLDYVKDIVKSLPSNDTELTLELGDEFPFKLRYAVGEDGDGSTRMLRNVEYMLAPRITSD